MIWKKYWLAKLLQGKTYNNDKLLNSFVQAEICPIKKRGHKARKGFFYSKRTEGIYDPIFFSNDFIFKCLQMLYFSWKIKSNN